MTPTLHHAADVLDVAVPMEGVHGGFEHTVRTGECAARAVFGMPGFEYLKANHAAHSVISNHTHAQRRITRVTRVPQSSDSRAVSRFPGILERRLATVRQDSGRLPHSVFEGNEAHRLPTTCGTDAAAWF